MLLKIYNFRMRATLFVFTVLLAITNTNAGNCACPRIFRPVCGTNGITYPNDCYRKCLNIPGIQCRGSCPCPQLNVEGRATFLATKDVECRPFLNPCCACSGSGFPPLGPPCFTIC